MAIDLLDQHLPHIRNSIFRQRISFPDWKMKEGDVENAHDPGLHDSHWTPIRIPFSWGRHNKTFWFRQTIETPAAFAGKTMALVLDFAEALVYVNGKPYQGVDKNHPVVLLSEHPRAQEQFHIAIQAASGRKKDQNNFARTDLVVLDPTARRLFHGLTVLHEMEKSLDHASQDARDIREIIQKTLVYVKWFKPESEAYPAQIERAYREMVTMIREQFRSSVPGVIHLIGHSHLDAAWLWTKDETIRKCARTFSTALRMMDESPEFKYTQSQPALYQFTKEHYPDLYKQIRQRILEGRWEATGAMWVEADCNIPSGESLVRQIVHGKRFLKQEFGLDSNIVWLPDTFGFTWALPQILKKAGVNFFHTSKLTWNDTTKFPLTTFWWQGIDGTRILSHIPPVGLEGSVTPKDIERSATALEPGAPVLSVMQTYGYGDGGGGVSREQIDTALILGSAPGLPAMRVSTAGEFFREVEQAEADLPVWNKELYLEKHRGTLTTHGWLKRAHRKTESALSLAELTASMAGILGKGAAARNYPAAEFDRLWKSLLFSQFHDILPGTCIHDVYDETRTVFAALDERTKALTEKSLGTMTTAARPGSRGFTFTLFNPLQWTRAEYVELSIPSREKHFEVADSAGTTIEWQIIERTREGTRILVYIPSIPGYGFVTLLVRPLAKSNVVHEPWKVAGHAMETPLVRVRFDGKGGLKSLYDKQLRRDLIPKGRRGNLFQTFHDKAAAWETWDIAPDYERQRYDAFQLRQMKVTETGPIRMTMRLEFRSEAGSLLNQDIHFYHKSHRVDFVTHARWREKGSLLKVAFPLSFKANRTNSEIPFGAIERTTRPVEPEDKAKFELPVQQWVDFSDQKAGAALLNDCKYGFDARDNVVRLSLIRSPHYPHPIEPSRLTDSEVTDLGDHEFTYALFPHAGDWRSGSVLPEARALNNPVVILPDRVPAIDGAFLTVSKPNVVIDAVKKADEGEGIIVRFHEAHGTATDVSLQFGSKCKGAEETDLLENTLKPFRMSKNRLTVRLKPFEIKTFRIFLKAKGR